MTKRIILVVAAAFLLAGCNVATTTYKTIDKDLFSMQIPDHWKEQTADDENGEIAFYSDDTAESFIEGSVAVFYYPDVVAPDAKLDQSYCDNAFDLINQSSKNDIFSGANKRQDKYVAATADRPAHCEIEYELVNDSNKDYVNKQVQKQYLFVSNNSELIVEVGTTKTDVPDYIQKVLDSFKVKPVKAS